MMSVHFHGNINKLHDHMIELTITRFMHILGMAQVMFQMQGLWNGFEYENLQRFQQGTLLRGVSIKHNLLGLYILICLLIWDGFNK